MTSPREQAVVIQGSLSTPMLGVLTSPGANMTPSGLGVVIVNGGAQYRAGAHRMHVQLARHLANAGHTTLRFDFPGQGDSPGDPVSFEATAPHIGAAIDALQRQTPPLQRLALFGLCDGASASLLYLHARPDPRITHLILLNPWVRSASSLARTQLKHYYLQRLLMPDFWRKLFRGGIGVSALLGLADRLRKLSRNLTQDVPGFQDRMAQAWQTFNGPILLLLSERDLTAQEFVEHTNRSIGWANWSSKVSLRHHKLPLADHTCSTLPSQNCFEVLTLDWLHSPACQSHAPERLFTE